jgi:transposase-like protein
MRKTAVEWLIDMLVKENELTLKGENYKLFEIAKQMENEQKPIHAAATPFSLPSKSIYKTLRKSGEHGVNIRKNIKKLLKNY